VTRNSNENPVIDRINSSLLLLPLYRSMSAAMPVVPEALRSSDVASLNSEGEMREHEEEDLLMQLEHDEQEQDLLEDAASGKEESGGEGDQSIRPARGVGKRPLMTHNREGKMLSEKKLRRLEKNRLSARECRRRKREATENLQRDINVLEGENLRLRLQLQIGDEAEENMKREQTKLMEDIDELLKSGASEADIHTALESYKEKYADYGRDRRSAIEFLLRNIERLLMPTQTTSVVMQAIQSVQQTDESSGATLNGSDPKDVPPASAATAAETDASEPPSAEDALKMDPSSAKFEPRTLFRYLVRHLGVTPKQAAALKDSRFVALEMDECLAEALKVLTELSGRMTQTGEDLETEFDNVRSILTPTQAAKFLVWVANNGAASKSMPNPPPSLMPHRVSPSCIP
jgi:hypothetical protein